MWSFVTHLREKRYSLTLLRRKRRGLQQIFIPFDEVAFLVDFGNAFLQLQKFRELVVFDRKLRPFRPLCLYDALRRLPYSVPRL